MTSRPWKEKCRQCEAEVTCQVYGPKDVVEDSDPGCSGILCDFADDRGCFAHYCGQSCFDAHRCGAHEPKEKA